MANNFIPEELEALIQQYLTDGVLTDKERQVILNKAEKMGLDRDEIDLYLDAEVQKIDQQTDAAVRKQKGKTCPFCGGSVPQLTDKCPHCSENITPEASTELQEILDNLEEALVDLKTAKDVKKSKAVIERYFRKAKTYYGSNPKVQKLLAELEIETINAEKSAKRKKTSDSVKNICKHLWKEMWKHWFISFFFVIPIVFCIVISIFIAPFAYFSDNKESKKFELFSTQIDSLIIEDRKSEIIQLLQENPIEDQYGKSEKYEQIYLKIIKAYLEKGDLKSAENIGLIYKTKAQLSDEEWTRTSFYFELLSAQIDKLIKEDRKTEITQILQETPIPEGWLYQKYEPIYFKIINAYLEKGDLKSAENIGLLFKAQISDEDWTKTSCYKILKFNYTKAGKDFSHLEPAK